MGSVPGGFDVNALEEVIDVHPGFPAGFPLRREKI